MKRVRTPPLNRHYAGFRLRITTSASGKSKGPGEAYALFALGQPVKLRVLYSFQVGPKTRGMLGSCSTMICCNPLRACCCSEESVVVAYWARSLSVVESIQRSKFELAC